MSYPRTASARAIGPSSLRLADFLRARRAAVRPGDLGLTGADHRRVPGLRRDEVARLAGVSETYYTHLEQGRDAHPSPQILEALGRPLMLDGSALRYAKQLAQPLPRRPCPRGVERVRPEMRRMVEALDRNPSIIIGRGREVLAANPLAVALNPGFREGTNLLRFVFLDPLAEDIYDNWEEVALEAVRTLRVAAADNLEDEALSDLIRELLAKSEDFRRVWDRHEVGEKTIGAKHFNHPLFGPLGLEYQSLTINGSAGQSVSIYSAHPGTRDDVVLRALIAATSRADRDPQAPGRLTR